MSKKLLKICVAIISTFPMLLGINGMINGLDPDAIEVLNGHKHILTSLDSNKRYLSSLLFMFGFLFFWILPRFDDYIPLFRLLLTFLFIGGLARVYSIFIYGLPGPLQLIVLSIELIVPIVLIPWHINVYGWKSILNSN